MPIDRDILRLRERTARQRRKINLRLMQRTVEVLECALIVAPTLQDASTQWDELLNENEKRIRRFLLNTTELWRDLGTLQRERAQLERLLREHQLWTRMLDRWIRLSPSTNDWHAKIVWIRHLTDLHFKSWTPQQWQDEMEARRQTAQAFRWQTDKPMTTDKCFLGWHHRQSVNSGRSVFHFQFEKTFRGCDLLQYVDLVWKAYTTTTLYQDIALGSRTHGDLEILQQFGDEIAIVRRMQRFPQFLMDIHIVSLVCQMKTDRGYVICVRPIRYPQLVKAIASPTDIWASGDYWMEWIVLENEEQAFMMRMTGTLTSRIHTLCSI